MGALCGIQPRLQERQQLVGEIAYRITLLFCLVLHPRNLGFESGDVLSNERTLKACSRQFGHGEDVLFLRGGYVGAEDEHTQCAICVSCSLGSVSASSALASSRL
jgi:hypothetical protein